MTSETQNHPDEEPEVHLRDYIDILLRHRWVILVCLLVIPATVLLYTMTETPLYQSTATLIIEPRTPKIYSVEEMLSADISSREYYNSQYKIIKSRPVARHVIEDLDLMNSREFFPPPETGVTAELKRKVKSTIAGWKKAAADLIDTGGDGAQADQLPLTPEEEAQSRYNSLIGALLGRITVEPVRDSRLVEISFMAKDPSLACRGANSTAESYIEFNLENRIEAAQAAAKWLEKRLIEAEENVEAAERELQAFKERHGIVTTFSEESEKLTAQSLSELNRQLGQAKARRVECEARYEQARALLEGGNSLDCITELLQSSIVSGINQKIVTLHSALAELSNTYGANHPKVVAIESQLNELEQKKRTETKKVVNSLKNEYEVALAREKSLETSLETIKQNAQSMNREAVEYGVLKRQAEGARNMYETLLRRYKEASLGKDIESGNIRLVEDAQVSKSPVQPNPKRNMMLGLAVALMLGVGMAFFLEYLDSTVKTPDDIKKLGLAYLAPIPRFAATKSSGGESAKVVAHHAPRSPAGEAYRSLRTGIILSGAENEPKTIAVTSPATAEGKTVTCVNLAVSMAQYGSRTLLIDCDLRKPMLHKYFQLSRHPGLSNLLAGDVNSEAAFQKSFVPNLDLLLAGDIPPNPSELLGGRRMKRLMEQISRHYDQIVIDTPPVTAVTDPALLAKLADGVVLVFRGGFTMRQQAKNAIEILKPLGVNIFGAILNAVEMNRHKYYYYQYYYYYYGDQDQKAAEKAENQ